MKDAFLEPRFPIRPVVLKRFFFFVQGDFEFFFERFDATGQDFLNRGQQLTSRTKHLVPSNFGGLRLRPLAAQSALRRPTEPRD